MQYESLNQFFSPQVTAVQPNSNVKTNIPIDDLSQAFQVTPTTVRAIYNTLSYLSSQRLYPILYNFQSSKMLKAELKLFLFNWKEAPMKNWSFWLLAAVPMLVYLVLPFTSLLESVFLWLYCGVCLLFLIINYLQYKKRL